MDTLVICPKCESLNRVAMIKASQAQAICGRCKTELPLHDGVQELSGASLRTLVQKSSRPVVVDFWAPWCGPCRAFAPIYQRAAQEFAGKLVFTKLNTEADPVAGDANRIRGIPTLVVFRDGSEVDRLSGALSGPALSEYLKKWSA